MTARLKRSWSDCCNRKTQKGEARAEKVRFANAVGALLGSCAFAVCKMLKVSMLQSLELINSVETGHFSTEFVEKPNPVRTHCKRFTSFPHLTCVDLQARQRRSSHPFDRIISVRMTISKILSTILFHVLLVSAAFAQRTEDVLATSKDITYQASSLSPEGQKFYLEKRRLLSETRTALLNEMVSESILEAESKLQNTTADKLLAAQRSKVNEPTSEEIQAISRRY